MRLNPDLSVDSTFVPVGLLYNLEHINHDGNDKIIIAGEPKRAFRLEHEQVQNIAIITKNGLELQTNQHVLKNILDTAAIPTGNIGKTSEQVFTIKNTGANAIELLDPKIASLIGQNSSDFSIRPVTVARTLQQNESMQFAIQFSPIAVGDKVAQIKIPFSDGVQQLYSVSIKASAVVAPTVTAVNDITEDKSIRIYPNPLNGTAIHVVADDLIRSYELLDVSGQVVQRGSLKHQSPYTIQVNKRVIGVFYLRLKADKKDMVTKIIRL
jgi:ribosomal protein L11